MPQTIKPTPLKHCSFCAAKLERKRFPNGSLESLLHFGRRKYCNRTCMAKAFDERDGLEVGWSTAHHHSRKKVPKGACELCGRPDAKDVDHKDGNFLNNSPDNLQRICRSCHSKKHKKRKLCVICGKPQKGLGYCEKHYQRFKKTGDPLKIKTPTRKACLICGAPVHSKNLCGRHYMQAKRRKEV